MTKKKTSSKKQSELPGVERKAIAELDDLVVVWHEAKEARILAQKPETEAKSALLARVRELRQTLPVNADGVPVYAYRDGDLAYDIEGSDEFKIKAGKVAPSVVDIG